MSVGCISSILDSPSFPSLRNEDPENLLQSTVDPAIFPPYRLAAQTRREGPFSPVRLVCRRLDSFASRRSGNYDKSCERHESENHVLSMVFLAGDVEGRTASHASVAERMHMLDPLQLANTLKQQNAG
jgi:hypothetical protein